MRMRKKPNLQSRLERCAAVNVTEPEALRGRWRELLPGCVGLQVELGCGKGRFTAQTAAQAPEILLVAMEKVPDAMVVAMERALDRKLENVRFLDRDVLGCVKIFAPGEVDRLYINFCDPWPKSRDAKHRLTAPGFLRSYAELLPLGGAVHFKTDNGPLFTWSLEQFRLEGWDLQAVTDDLHGDGPVGIMTDYEAKFHAQGVPIHRLEAVKTAETKTIAAGEPERLRNASLADARANQEGEERVCG